MLTARQKANRKRFLELHPNYNREWYLANKERIDAEKREYVKKHREEIMKYQHEYYVENKKYFKNYFKSYYAEHKSEFRERYLARLPKEERLRLESKALNRLKRIGEKR